MGHWNIVTIDNVGVAFRNRRVIRRNVTDQLVSKEVEINPGFCAASFRTTEQLSVKTARLRKVANSNREMKWRQVHG